MTCTQKSTIRNNFQEKSYINKANFQADIQGESNIYQDDSDIKKMEDLARQK